MQTVMQNKPLQKNCNPASQQNQQTGSFRKSKPKANIFTKNDGWEISLSLPGFTKEDVSISLDRHVLKISGTQEAKKEEYNRKEWSLESFDRSFRLPEDANMEEISAEMKNGILTVFLHKTEKKVSKIEVK
ncbi:MAG: Hsp20/alpha crystallin family protein [Saprospiraceae bacterium]|nr:Hsp20/alpha crystallin family protein [Saprospiraceae bacterium]MBK7522926.1 Hsp20/alpha crystallin family protein [Saprospiraceae bacterium]MBK8370696.1 Hsp20/alpha crystallin family protein [Saprospiraceae bacterium]MBK8854452.1 Hsp20/alpha crystallin family protein [Saprospiraceae bacterium]MBK9044590.1 Hsp20/alpha crystallin family protein [Saprospiraceae bacterium]